MAYWARLVALLLCVAVAISCGGSNGGVPPTPTPPATETAASTATPTGTPAPTATAVPPASPTPTVSIPEAAAITVDPGVMSVGEGLMRAPVSAGGTLNLDPVDLAQGLGIVPPACAELVFYLSWQVRQPYPPAGVMLELYWTRMGATELIGSGPSGQASRGCGGIQVLNNGAADVTVEIRYAIGQIIP